MDKNILGFVTFLILPTLPILCFAYVYLIHSKLRPSISHKSATIRRMIYAVILMIIWSVPISIAVNFIIIGSYPAPFCTADGICVPENYPTTQDFVLTTIWIMFIGLIESVIFYVAITFYDRKTLIDRKPKRKIKPHEEI